VFSRGYVDKIRGEAQRYREQATTASQAQNYDEVARRLSAEDREDLVQPGPHLGAGPDPGGVGDAGDCQGCAR
jgi:hypothetical protein